MSDVSCGKALRSLAPSSGALNDHSPASFRFAGGWYMELRGKPASPGRANESTASVCSFLPASPYPGLGRPAVGASFAMQSLMKRIR